MRDRPAPRPLAAALAAVALAAAPAVPALAGVATDGSLGPKLTLSGPTYLIGAELGRRLGDNLFHSFGAFSIAKGEAARFGGPPSVVNVIGRVTGGEASTIDGRIGSDIAGANLFLINPAGVMFGPDASLDLTGSFHAGTADYLRLADGTRFEARADSGIALSVAPPAAFGFLGPEAAPVAVDRSVLRVASGKTLSLVGGPLEVRGGPTGYLRAPFGSIQLAAVAGAGEVGVDLASPATTVSKLAPMRIHDDALIDTGGRDSRVVIRAGQLVVESSVIRTQSRDAGGGGAIDIAVTGDVTLDASALRSSTNHPGAAGDIRVAAGTMTMSGGSSIDASTFAKGPAGAVSLVLGELRMSAGSGINASSDDGATGAGGSISILASRGVRLEGAETGVRANAIDAGAAGSVSIATPVLELAGAHLETGTNGGAPAGQVRLDVGDLRMTEGARIRVGTYGEADAGTLRIAATGEVALAGTDADGLPTRLWAGSYGAGDSGRIEIVARSLSLTGEARISGETIGTGAGGTILVRAGSLSLTDGSDISTEVFSGSAGGGLIDVDVTGPITIVGRREPWNPSPGSDRVSTGLFTYVGTIRVRAESLTVSDSGAVASRTFTDQDGGGITIDVARLTVLDGAEINTDSMGSSYYLGHAGSITVNATESVRIAGDVEGRKSGIRAGTRSSGDAGSIHVTTPLLQIGAGGMINTSTGVFGSGSAGEIRVDAGTVLLDGGIIISNSAGHGGAGGIVIDATGQVALGPGGGIAAFGDDEGLAGRIAVTTPLLSMNAGLINTETASARPGGDIVITADRVSMDNGSRIKSDSWYTGDAGSILIQAGTEFRAHDSAVTTQAVSASGGNILVRSPTIILEAQSPLSATVYAERGDGGNVTLDAVRIAAVQDSDLTARADQGYGGRITVNARVFLRSPDTRLDASSNVIGNDGVVEINAPALDLTGTVVALPRGFLQAEPLLSDRCSVRFAGRASTLVQTGRGGLPPDPEDYLLAGSGACPGSLGCTSAPTR